MLASGYSGQINLDLVRGIVEDQKTVSIGFNKLTRREGWWEHSTTTYHLQLFL